MSDQASQNAAQDAAEDLDHVDIAGDDEQEASEPAAATLDADALRRELEKVRRQAARYRRERNELRARLTDDPVAVAQKRAAEAERRARVTEALAESNVPVSLYRLMRDVDSADDIAPIIEQIAGLVRAPANGPTLPKPQSAHGASVDELIAEAERTGNVREAIRLKTIKSLAR